MPLQTYQEFALDSPGPGGSIREDLLDFIENLSPKDTPLFNNLGALQVHAGYVEHLSDTLTAASTNAWSEGGAATDVALTMPTRRATVIQNFQAHFWVSGRTQAVNHAGLATPLAYQEVKQMRILKTDVELALHRGTVVTGPTTAPQTAGFITRASGGVTTYNTASSGTTLTERVFNDLITLSYSTPVNLREVYTNMFVKRTINGYTTDTTRWIPAGDKRQVDIIEVYESEVGVLSIFKSRYQLQAATVTAEGNSFLVIDPDFFQVAWLRQFRTFELGLDGDRVRKMIVGELGLLQRQEEAAVVGTGYVAYLP